MSLLSTVCRPHARFLQRFIVIGPLLLVCFLAPARASEYLATDDFGDVEQVVTSYADVYGTSHVLLVVDIDNTLLAMNHDLGSDQWFEWQQFLLENEPDSRHLVARSLEGLLQAQG